MTENHQHTKQKVSNSYIIEFFVEQIGVLRSQNVINYSALSDVRFAASKSLNLPLHQYLDWIDDTANNTPHDLKRIVDIALNAFPYSAEIYEKYFNYSQAESSDPQNWAHLLFTAQEKTRYFPAGVRIWDIWHNYIQSLEIFETVGLTCKLIKESFWKRLDTPHETIDQTFSQYSTFISANEPDIYEEEMISAQKLVSQSKKQFNQRRKFESQIKQEPSLASYSSYIDWDLSRKDSDIAKSNGFISACYERALELVASIPEIWDDYLVFISDPARGYLFSTDLNEFYKRATRFCPSSGKLWSLYLEYKTSFAINSNIQELHGHFDEMEEFKDAILEGNPFFAAGSITSFENFVAVSKSWLSFVLSQSEYLKLEPIDDIIDEFATLRESWGLPPDYENYDFEKFLIASATSIDMKTSAEKVWKRLCKANSKKADFWAGYLKWLADENKTPERVREVALISLEQKYLDNPDKVMETWLSIASIHNQAQLPRIYAECRSAIKKMNRRKWFSEQERLKHAQTHTMVTDEQKKDEELATDNSDVPLKRRNEDEENAEEPKQKSVKTNELVRDREHTTIIVTELPKTTNEGDIINFFADCGQPKSVQMNGPTALVEFSSHDDYLAAKTKDWKELNGKSIRVTSGESTTVWVANFPPFWTQESLEKLFGEIGQVLSVRLPSLKFNTNRRFAYVQFSEDQSAFTAVRDMNGKEVDSKYQLVVKISDPSQRQERSGALAEGREVIAKGINFKVSEDEIRTFFSQFGTLDKLKIPPSKYGSDRVHDGYAFITYEEKEEAERAVSEGHGEKFGGRNITVTLAKERNRETKHVGESHRGDDYKSRLVHISNLLDTVNDAQLRNAVEKYGSVNKIIIRPNRGTATIEFSKASEAGKASLSLDGSFFLGRNIRVGDSNGSGEKSTTVSKPVVSSKPSTIFVPRNIKRK